MANTTVTHCGEQVPVCRIHEEVHARWAGDAERRAIELWNWPSCASS